MENENEMERNRFWEHVFIVEGTVWNNIDFTPPPSKTSLLLGKMRWVPCNMKRFWNTLNVFFDLPWNTFGTIWKHQWSSLNTLETSLKTPLNLPSNTQLRQNTLQSSLKLSSNIHITSLRHPSKFLKYHSLSSLGLKNSLVTHGQTSGQTEWQRHFLSCSSQLKIWVWHGS